MMEEATLDTMSLLLQGSDEIDRMRSDIKCTLTMLGGLLQNSKLHHNRTYVIGAVTWELKQTMGFGKWFRFTTNDHVMFESSERGIMIPLNIVTMIYHQMPRLVMRVLNDYPGALERAQPLLNAATRA